MALPPELQAFVDGPAAVVETPAPSGGLPPELQAFVDAGPLPTEAAQPERQPLPAPLQAFVDAPPPPPVPDAGYGERSPRIGHRTLSGEWETTVGKAIREAYPAPPLPHFTQQEQQVKVEAGKIQEEVEGTQAWGKLGMVNPFAGRRLFGRPEDVQALAAANVRPEQLERQAHDDAILLDASLDGAIKFLRRAFREGYDTREPVASIIGEGIAETTINRIRTRYPQMKDSEIADWLVGKGVGGAEAAAELGGAAAQAVTKYAGAAWEKASAPLAKAGAVLSVPLRGVADMARELYEQEIAVHNRRARAGQKDEHGNPLRPIIDPATGQPYSIYPKTSSQIMDDLGDALALKTWGIPQSARATVDWIDVTRAHALLNGGTGNEPWVGFAGFGLDVVADPLNLVGVGVASKVTKFARLRGLAPILEIAEKAINPTNQFHLSTSLVKMLETMREMDRLYAAGAKGNERLAPLLAHAVDLEEVALDARGLADLALRHSDEPTRLAQVARAEAAEVAATRVRKLAQRFDAQTFQVGVPFARMSGVEAQVDLLIMPRLGLGVHLLPRFAEKPRAREVLEQLDEIDRDVAGMVHGDKDRIRSLQRAVESRPNLTADMDLLTRTHEFPHEAAGRAGFRVSAEVAGTMPEGLADKIGLAFRSAYAGVIATARDPAELAEGLDGLLERFVEHIPDEHVPQLYERLVSELARQDDLIARSQQRIGDNLSHRLQLLQGSHESVRRKIADLQERLYWEGQRGSRETVARLERSSASLVATEKRIAAQMGQLKRRISEATEQAAGEVAGQIDTLGQSQQQSLRLARHGDKFPLQKTARSKKSTASQLMALSRHEDSILARGAKATQLLGEATQVAGAGAETSVRRAGYRGLFAATDAAQQVTGTLEHTQQVQVDRLRSAVEKLTRRMSRGVAAGVNAVEHTRMGDMERGLGSLGAQAGREAQRVGEAIGRKSTRKVARELLKAETTRDAGMDAIYGLVGQARQHATADLAEYNARLAQLDGGLFALHEWGTGMWNEALYAIKKEGIPVGELEAYIPHIFYNKDKILRSFYGEGGGRYSFWAGAAIDPTKHRTQGSVVEMARLGYEPVTDYLELAMHTQQAKETLIRKARFKRAVAEKFGIETKGRFVDPEKYVTMEHGGKQYAVPKEVKEAVDRLNELYKPANWGPFMEKTKQVLGMAQGFWKAKVLGHVGFVPVNVIGNEMMMRINGFSGSLSSYGIAAAVAQVGHLYRAETEALAKTVRAGGLGESKLRSALRGTVRALPGAAIGGLVGGPAGAAAGAAAGFTSGALKWKLRAAARSAHEYAGQVAKFLRVDAATRATRIYVSQDGTGRFTGQQLYDAATRTGIMRSGWVMADNPTMRDIFRFQHDPRYRFARTTYRDMIGPVNPLGSTHYLAKSVQGLNEGFETHQRLTMWIDRVLNYNDSFIEAARRTELALGLYAGYNKHEKFARGLVPFYGWTKTNVRAQIASIFHAPSTLTISPKVQHAFGDYYEHTVDRRKRILEKDLPFFVRGSLGFPIKPEWMFGAAGADVEDQLLYINLNLPCRDWNLFSMDAGQQWMSMMTPMLKAPLEFVTKRRFDTGQELDEDVPLGGALESVGQALFERFPNYIKRVPIRTPDGRSKYGYTAPGWLIYTLRTMEPDVSGWDRWLFPTEDVVEKRRQVSRSAVELYGIPGSRLIRPEMEISNVLREGRTEGGLLALPPRGGGGTQRGNKYLRKYGRINRNLPKPE